jgi:chromosome segregation ATPase
MYLKELEINGFKSFANKSSLKFDSPISAIVGPNGSGKSNIAEAFRFVLGEQSFKSMRGKRGEDLIFSGTGTSGKQSRASVKVYFDNSDKTLPVDFEEVSIERTVYRDGTNEYKINGSVVRLKDIIELLSGANIGSSGHHIISQGEADRILNTSPKERKTILEEALGLKIFEYKKTESQRKLEKTEENIKQVQSLRREIAPHIKFLQKQVEKIEEGKQIKAKLVELYREYFKREELYLKYKKEELAHAIDEPKRRLTEIDNKITEYRAVAEKEEQSELKDQIQSLQNDLGQVNSEKTELIRQQGQTEGQLQSLEKLLSKQEVAEKKQITINQTELESLEGQISEIHKKIENESDLMIVREKISQIVSLISGFIKSQSGEDVREQDNEMLEEISNVKDQLSKIIYEIENVDQKEKDLQTKLSDLREQLEADKTDSLVAEKEIIKLMTEKNELQQIISKHSVEIHNFNKDEEDFKQEILEAHSLSGREATDYENLQFSEGDLHIQDKEIATEDRQKQLDRKKEIDRLKIKVEEFGGGSGEEIIREFEESNERDKFLLTEIEDLEKSAESLKQLITDLEEKINQKFHEGIKKINSEFQKFFELMFGGGNASIKIIKLKSRVRRDTDLDFGQEDEIPEEENQEEGLEVDVSLPRKKVKSLMMLSGGERALTSIALIFAMSQVNPPPFIILDETDAALDEANSRKYGDMIENLSKHSQLILITHNRETMGRAGVLYGVTMTQGISKMLSINFDDGIEWAK